MNMSQVYEGTVFCVVDDLLIWGPKITSHYFLTKHTLIAQFTIKCTERALPVYTQQASAVSSFSKVAQSIKTIIKNPFSTNAGISLGIVKTVYPLTNNCGV